MIQFALFRDDLSGAIFSDCLKYRFVLWRIWDKSKPMVMYVGLNPSTANELKNDPTIKRVIRISKKLGFGGIYMLNLFAWITSNPEDLKVCADPVGDNDKWLFEYGRKCDIIIVAWGSFKEAKERAKEFFKMFRNVFALKINKDGSPMHPLYVPNPIKLKQFTL